MTAADARHLETTYEAVLVPALRRYSSIFRIPTNDRDDFYQDVAQRVFQVVERNRDPIEFWKAYVGRVTFNCSRDYIRSHARSSRVKASEDEPDTASDGPCTAEARQMGEFRVALDEFLADLSEREMKVFTLYFLDGHTTNVVAHQLRLGQDTVQRDVTSIRAKAQRHGFIQPKVKPEIKLEEAK